MKRDTSRLLKALDMDLLRAALTLENLVRERATLDEDSTEELVAELAHSLRRAARGRIAREPTP